MSRTRVKGNQVQGNEFETLRADLTDIKTRTGYIRGYVNTAADLALLNPQTDDQIFVRDENKVKRFDGASWIDVSGGGASVDVSQLILHCTSTTRPDRPKQGQHIYESDTKLTLVNNGSEAVPLWEALASGSGGGGADPELEKRVSLLESNLSAVRQTFNEDFIEEVRVDRTKTTATVGTGYVRTEKLAVYNEDFTTTNNLNLTDSYNVTVDTTLRKVTLNQGILEGQLVTKTIPTSGTQRATVDIQAVTPSDMAFGDKTQFVPWASVAVVLNMRVSLDRVGRKWEAYSGYISGFTGVVHYRCYNLDGSVAFTGQVTIESRDAATGSVAGDNFQNIRMIADLNNNMWMHISVYASNGSVMKSRMIMIKPDGTVGMDIEKPADNYQTWGELLVDRNNRTWFVFGSGAGTIPNCSGVYNSDGTAHLTGLPANGPWSQNTNYATMAEDTKRGRVVIYSWSNGTILSNIAAVDYNGSTVLRLDARFGISGTGQAAVAVPSTQISRALSVKMVYDEALDKLFLIGTYTSSTTTSLAIIQWNAETLIAESYAKYDLPNIPAFLADFVTENGITYFTFKSHTVSGTFSNISFAALKHSDKSLAIQETKVTQDLDGYHHFVKMLKNREGNFEVYGQKSAGASGSATNPRDFFRYTYLNRPATVDMEISNDGGVTWHPALPATEVIFPALGNELKIRAKLKSPLTSNWITPELKFISVSETGPSGSYTRELYTTKLPTPQPTTQVQLTATQELYDGTINWFVSNDGGASWHSILLGEDFSFTRAGSDVRLRAVIDVPSTANRGPIIRGYSLQASSLTSAQAVDDLRTQLMQTNFRLIAMQAANRYSMKNMVIDNFIDLTGIDTSKSTPFSHTGGSLRIGEANVALMGYGGTSTHTEPFDGDIATYMAPNSTVTRTLAAGELILGYEIELQQQATTQNLRFRPSINGVAGSLIETGNMPGNQPAIFRVNLPQEEVITTFAVSFTALTGPCNIAEVRLFKRVGSATIITLPVETITAPKQALIVADETVYEAGAVVKYYISRDGGVTWTKADQGSSIDLSSQPTGTKLCVKMEINGNVGVNALGLTWS